MHEGIFHFVFEWQCWVVFLNVSEDVNYFFSSVFEFTCVKLLFGMGI